jgi:hypothetical protein
MIEQAIVWVGENAIAVASLGIGAIALFLAIYLNRNMPDGPEQDEHAREGFIG